MEDYIRKSLNESLVKERVYVDDPSEAPEDADVQEGEQGGYFYISEGGGGGGSSGEEPISEPADNPEEWVEPDAISEENVGDSVQVQFEYEGDMYDATGEVMDNGSIGLDDGGGVLDPSDVEAVRFSDGPVGEERDVSDETPERDDVGNDFRDDEGFEQMTEEYNEITAEIVADTLAFREDQGEADEGDYQEALEDAGLKDEVVDSAMETYFGGS